jgi:AmmeMemoRadiSam system protein B
MVRELFEEVRLLPGAAGHHPAGPPAGLLVPHAGYIYSGVVAAAAWVRLQAAIDPRSRLAVAPTVVLLGTHHGPAWLDGVAAWEAGAWRTPLGDVEVDRDIAAAILELGPPFHVDRDAHDGEHSIEVQLPILQLAVPFARIVPLAVAAGIGHGAIAAGRRLGELLGRYRADGAPLVLAISSDMAHYPPADACEEVTEALTPSIRTIDPVGLAAREIALRGARIPNLVCGMCGIQPAVLGLAALSSMGVRAGSRLAAATSADADGPRDRTVGYLAMSFEG